MGSPREIVGFGIAVAAGIVFQEYGLFWALAVLGGGAVIQYQLAEDIEMPSFDAAAAGGAGLRANTRSPQEPIKVMYGQLRVGGNDVYMGLSGTDNKILWIVQTLGEGECEGIAQVDGVDQVFLGDLLYTEYGGNVSYWFHNGSALQTLDTNLNAALSEWTDPLRYTSYMVWKLTYDSDYFQSLPRRSIVLKGRRLYDFRIGELITNGGMEGDAHWVNEGTPTLNVRSSEQKHDGSYSRKFTVDAEYEGIKSDTFSTTTGIRYKACFWVYPTDTNSIRAGAYRGDAGGWNTGVDFDNLTLNAWNYCEYTYTEAGGGSGAYFVIVSKEGISSGTWYADDASLIKFDYSNNPVLCLHDWMTSKRYGMSVDISKIDATSWTSAANYCDAKGWTLNMAVTQDQAAVDVRNAMLAHFRGGFNWWDGKCYLRYADLNEESSVMTLEDKHIAQDESGKAMISITEQSRFQIPDGVRVKFTDPDRDYIVDDFPVGDETGVVKEVKLLGCTNRQQAADLGVYTLERLKLNRAVSGRFRDDALKLEPHDPITLNSTALAISNQLMRVKRAQILADGLIDLTLIYESINLYDDDYNFDAEGTYQCSLPDPTAEPPSVTGVSMSEETYDYRLRTFTRLKVSFNKPIDYAWFDHVEVWLKLGIEAGFQFYSSVEDYIILPQAILNGLNDVTVEFRYKTSKTGNQGIVSGANASSDNAFLIFFNNSTTVWHYYETATGQERVEWTISDIADGVERHYAITHNKAAAQAELFINGVSQGTKGLTTPQTVAIDEGGLIIGQDQDEVGGGFQQNQAADGILRELRFWSDIRTQTEIEDNMDQELTGSEANLNAYYKAKEDTGTSAKDYGPNGYDGLIQGRVLRWEHIFDSTTDFAIDPVEEGITYYIRLKAVSIWKTKQKDNNDYKTSRTIGGYTDVPASLSSLLAVVNASTINLYAAKVSDPDVEVYEFRLGSSWSGAIFLAALRSPNLSLYGVKPGNHTFMANTLSNNGAYGSTPRSASAVLKDPPDGWSVQVTESIDTLITNGDMELDSNWSNYGSPTVNERSGVQKHQGTYSRKFTSDSAGDGIRSENFTTVNDGKYGVSLWVYPDDGTKVKVRVYNGDGLGGSAYIYEYTNLTQDAWNEIFFTYQEGAAAGGSSAYIAVYDGSTGSGSWYVDDVCLMPGEYTNMAPLLYNGEAYIKCRHSGSFSGTYKSPIFNRGSVGRYLAYILAGIVVVGTGTTWNDAIPGSTMWNDINIGTRSWNEIFELAAGPSVAMKLKYGETSPPTSEVEKLEILSAIAEGQYFQVEIAITDPSDAINAYIENYDLKFCQ